MDSNPCLVRAHRPLADRTADLPAADLAAELLHSATADRSAAVVTSAAADSAADTREEWADLEELMAVVAVVTEVAVTVREPHRLNKS